MKAGTGTKLRKWVVNASLVLAALLAGFGIGEITARVLYSNSAMLYPRFHTSYQYGNYTIRGMRPNAVFRHTGPDGCWEFRTNSRGFRNTEDFAYEKPDSTLRVLSVGDSFTQGYEVRQEYTYSAALERYLRTRGRSAQVINAGVSGFSTEEGLIFLQEEGIRYHPDFVVLGLYANDFVDNLRADLFNLSDSDSLLVKSYSYIPGVSVQDVVFGFPVTRYLSEHSYFYSMLFNMGWDYFKLRSRTSALSDLASEYAITTKESLTDYELRLELALIRQMAQTCRTHGARLIVLDIPRAPFPHQVGPSIPEALRKGIQDTGADVLMSKEVLANVEGAGEFHVPHGHHHISELTHTLLGVALGERILAAVMERPHLPLR